MLFNYALAVPGSLFTQRFKVWAEFLWVEFLVSVRLRAAHALSIMYAHHVTSESCDACIYAQVVLPTSVLVSLPQFSTKLQTTS